MPSSKNYVRDYKQERKTAISRGETSVGSSSSDAIRHRARRTVEKKLGKSLGSDVHVDHKTPLSKSKKNANSPSNLRVRTASSNTSDGGKMGSRKGKASGARKGHRSR